MGPDAILFDRVMLLDAMVELASELQARGVAARINVIGGAAIALQYDPDRPATTDVDAFAHPAAEVLDAAATVGRRHGWPADWLNTNAKAFASHHDSPEDWTAVLDTSGLTVSVASAALLFAMKANASRGIRDGRDLLTLADCCGITSLVSAEAVFDRYFPRDVLPDKAVRWLDAYFRGEEPFAL